MQVNVERMPYGLFRQLGSDRKLLSAFAVTFALALGVAALSAIPDRSWVPVAIVAAIWATVLILVFFLYAYRRALSLISPTMQVQFIIQDATKYLNMWARRAKRIAPLIQAQDEAPAQGDPRRTGHDTAGVVFYGLNAHWTEGPRRSLQYLVSIARRYAEKGDHDVAETALSGLVAINAAYVKAKGKTFFTTHFMIDHPLSTDSFVNASLEHLRQYAKAAIARRDEEQIEQAFRAFTALVRVYVTIDYSDPHATKTHAGLAAGYLSQEVEAVIPHDMPVVLMEGVRLMGQAAEVFRAVEAFKQIQLMTEKMHTVGAVGAVKENHRHVTLQGVQELATLTFSLMRTKGPDLRFTLERIRKDVATIAKLLLTLVPDTPLVNAHSTYLAPYYSATSTTSLSARLSQLVNLLLNAEAGNEDAQAVIHNIEQWAEELYATEKKLLLLAVARRSHLTFDMIAWIRNVTELLLATSQSPACDAHTRDELQKHAVWLAAVLSWLPDDADTIGFLEAFPLAETMFEITIEARRRECPELALEGRKLLLEWAFKAGRYRGGWKGIEALCGSATLALLGTDADRSWLIQGVAQRLASPEAPTQEVRQLVARALRERNNRLRRRSEFSVSRLQHAMGQVDQAQLRAMLLQLAEFFAPSEPEGSVPQG